MTYSFGQCVLIRVIRWSALLYLFQQQRVFDQTAAGEIQEVPQVQFAAEGRLLTQAQEMLHSFLLLLLIQQGFGPHLVTAVRHIGLQARELWRMKWKKKNRVKVPTLRDLCDFRLLRNTAQNTGSGESVLAHPVEQRGPHLSNCLLWSPQSLETT